MNRKGPPYDAPRRPLRSQSNPKGPPYDLARPPFRSPMNPKAPPYDPPERPPNRKPPPVMCPGTLVARSDGTLGNASEVTATSDVIASSLATPLPTASRFSRFHLISPHGRRPVHDSTRPGLDLLRGVDVEPLPAQPIDGPEPAKLLLGPHQAILVHLAVRMELQELICLLDGDALQSPRRDRRDPWPTRWFWWVVTLKRCCLPFLRNGLVAFQGIGTEFRTGSSTTRCNIN